MAEKNIEREILARIRTLLALERNYLAEKRTNLAKLRTGIALLLIIPPIYIFAISLQTANPLFFWILILLFIITIGGWGILMITISRSDLKKLRLKIKKVKADINKIIKDSKLASDLLKNHFSIDE